MNAHAAIAAPVGAELAAAYAAREVFPTGHAVVHSQDSDDRGRSLAVAKCECGVTFRLLAKLENQMAAEIERHWRKFDHVDDRGQPVAGKEDSVSREGKQAERPDSVTVPSGEAEKESQRADDHTPVAPFTEAANETDLQITDPIVAEYYAAHRARKVFPLGHTVSMTLDHSTTGNVYSVGTCDCGASFCYMQGEVALMDAAIEAHWQKFDQTTETDDGREVVASRPEPEAAQTAPQAEAAKAEKSEEITENAAVQCPDAAAPEPAGADSSAPQPPAPAGSLVSDAAHSPAANPNAPLSPPATEGDDEDIAIAWPRYEDFLEDKIVAAGINGLDISGGDVNPMLKPHQRDIVVWAVRGGQRAIFAAFGLGKTFMQIEILRLVLDRVRGNGLIVLPLGVRGEFLRDAERLGVEFKFIRQDAEIEPGYRFYLTNYESVRDGKLNPARFVVASLDESSVLRSYGSKTFQEFLPLFGKTRYRFVATATPAPNRYKELIHYSGFLGVMDTGQALTRFFQRNSEKAGDLTLYPHKEQEFWTWIHSWACFLQAPSNLGYSDDEYVLPELKVVYHEVPSNHELADAERDGQRVLFRNAARSLHDASRERRETIGTRVARLVGIVNDYRRKACIQQSLPDQKSREAAGQAARAERSPLSGKQGSVQSAKQEMARGESRALCRTDAQLPPEKSGKDEGGIRGLVQSEQGASGNDGLDRGASQLWSDDRGIPGDDPSSSGPVRDLRRADDDRANSGDGRSPARDGQGPWSSLQAMQYGAGPVRRQSGATHDGSGLPDQIVIWCDLNNEQQAIEKALAADGISCSSLYGNQSIDEREQLLEDWRARKTSVFLSKPVMYGAGVNLQQCHTMIFVGISYKFQDLIQAVHRIYRFLQEHPCEVHIIHSEAERDILAILKEKWAQHEAMTAAMADIIRAHGLDTLPLRDALARSIGVKRVEIAGGERNGAPLWRAINNDAVAECRTWPDNSIDQVVTSIPFSNHYEYSASYNDFGHTDDNAHFWRQMDFLTAELHRMLRPGRLACIHVKDRVLFGAVTGEGVPTISPFHAEAIMHYRAHGFQYMGMITVVTDVVRENNQTYRLGWSECCKDGSKMGVGSPEYVLLMRKRQSDRSRSYADVPVVRQKKYWLRYIEEEGLEGEALDEARAHNKAVAQEIEARGVEGDIEVNPDGQSRARWQIDAHAFWRSSGNRLLASDEIAGLSSAVLAKVFAGMSAERVYDYEAHVRIGEELERRGTLPATFMCIAPGSTDDNTWHDVVRMRTLNMLQQKKGAEKHICPLQFDIVDRLIERYSNPGELIFDPFGGLMTVPYRAILKGRRGAAVELNATYFLDGVQYLRAAEGKLTLPALFDLAQFDATNTPPSTDMMEAAE